MELVDSSSEIDFLGGIKCRSNENPAAVLTGSNMFVVSHWQISWSEIIIICYNNT